MTADTEVVTVILARGLSRRDRELGAAVRSNRVPPRGCQCVSRGSRGARRTDWRGARRVSEVLERVAGRVLGTRTANSLGKLGPRDRRGPAPALSPPLRHARRAHGHGLARARRARHRDGGGALHDGAADAVARRRDARGDRHGRARHPATDVLRQARRACCGCTRTSCARAAPACLRAPWATTGGVANWCTRTTSSWASTPPMPKRRRSRRRAPSRSTLRRHRCPRGASAAPCAPCSTR